MRMLSLLSILALLALGTGCGKTCTIDDDDEDTGEDTGGTEQCYDAGYEAFENGDSYDPAAAGCEDSEVAYEAGWCQATEDQGLFDPEC